MEDLKYQFVEVIDKNKSLIYKFCYMYANETDTPQDLFQEVVFNLWKGFPSFRGECMLQTWIYRVALNTCVSFLRKSGRRPQTIPICDEIQVYAEMSDNSRIHELYDLINKLTPVEKAIILLYLEERNYDEIAQIIGMSKTNVGVRINRIKSKLVQMSK